MLQPRSHQVELTADGTTSHAEEEVATLPQDGFSTGAVIPHCAVCDHLGFSLPKQMNALTI